jgi:ComF family protein
MKTPPFTHTLAALKYQFPADRLVQSFKFNRQLVAGRILSRIMSERAIRTGIDLPGAIIPVPLHRRRLVQRGFNQAYELAADISKHLNLPLLAMALRRRRNTKAQSGLNRKQRRKNLSNAFYWAGATKPCRHIALVDDVMTTGTTVAECTRVLKTAGAKRVDVWVAARAIRARKR